MVTHVGMEKVLEEDNDQDAYELHVRRGYGRVREAWERFIEEALLAGAVVRFRKGVEKKRLRAALIEDEHFKAVCEGDSALLKFHA